MSIHRQIVATLSLMLLQACGCGTNRQVVENNEDARPFWEPKIRQVAHTEESPLPVIESLSNPGEMHVSYARWKEEIGALPEARQHYELALQQDPEHLGALIGLAQLELKAGNASAAEQLLAKARQVAPESSAVAFAMGTLRAHQRRWDDAVEAFNQASLAEPTQSAYRFQLAVALAHAGKVEMAMPHFIRTVGDAEAHYNVGRILHDEGRLREAEEHFVLAVAKKPDLEAAHEWLNRTRLSLRQSAEQSATAQAGDSTSRDRQIETVGYLTPAT